jgi:DNA-binding IclR family transcriptional regulator
LTITCRVLQMDPMSTPSLDLVSSSRAGGSAKALVKGLALVDLVAAADGAVRLVDLVEASGLPRPTAIRLLDVLVTAEVLRAGDDGGYTLGPRVASWGQAFLDRLDLRASAVDAMRDLVATTGETSFLGTLDAGRVLYLMAVDGPQAVRPAARAGHRNPLHCTAMGKVLLAHLPEATARGLLAEPLERRTPNTITDVGTLFAHLAQVQFQGFAVDEIENEDGIRCLAAPVRDHTEAVVAVVSVAAPAYRMPHDRLLAHAPDVLATVAAISHRLGYRRTP